MRRVAAAWRRGGVRGAAYALSSRLRDRLADRRAGFATGGLLPIETLIGDWAGCHDYFPTAYAELRAVLAALAPGPDDVFVDIGAGKGRALLVAAEFPFRALVGVEIAPVLCAEARANVAAHGSRIRIVEGDADRFALPDDATIVYLYNPFHGARLIRLFAQVAKSLERAPRALRIVYNNPAHFEPLEHGYPWLRREAEHVFEHRWVVYRASGGKPMMSAPGGS